MGTVYGNFVTQKAANHGQFSVTNSSSVINYIVRGGYGYNRCARLYNAAARFAIACI